MLDEFKELIGQSKDIFHKTFKYKDTNTYKIKKVIRTSINIVLALWPE